MDEEQQYSDLDAFKVGDGLKMKTVDGEEHKTQPPARFTEPQLVAELEKKGIGRPATYSQIVTVNQDRGYVEKTGKQLYPTFKGMKVAQILENKMPSFVDYGYTAEMEKHLDEIETGKTARNAWLDSIWHGPDGIKTKILPLMDSIDWDEIRELSKIDLHNGYFIALNRYGAWLKADGETTEIDPKHSVRVDDDALKDESLTAEECSELFKKKAYSIEDNVLGVLEDGPYKGWSVSVREGSRGPYIQATKITRNGNRSKSVKPIFKSIPEGKDPKTLRLDDVRPLFDKIALPRWSKDNLFFVGIGKLGKPYIGHKKTARSKAAQFISMPEDMDVYTVPFDEVEEYWNNNKPSGRRRSASR